MTPTNRTIETAAACAISSILEGIADRAVMVYEPEDRTAAWYRSAARDICGHQRALEGVLTLWDAALTDVEEDQS